MKNKIPLILVGVLVCVLASGLYLSLHDDPFILLCLEDNHRCTVYKAVEVYSVSADGSCIAIGNTQEYCRPEFEIFHLKALEEKVVKSCAEDLKGTSRISEFVHIVAPANEWASCDTNEGVYKYNPFKHSWEKAQ